MTLKGRFAPKRGKPSLKWRLVRIVLLCWILPVLLISVAMFGVATDSLNEKTLQSYKDTASFTAQIITERLDMAVDASRLTSYDDAIKRAYREFRISDNDAGYSGIFSVSQNYVTRRFRSDDRFRCAIMWFWDNPEQINCSTYNESIGGRDSMVSAYWKQDHKAISELAATLDTGVAFLNCDGRIYLVRNVMDGNLNPMAVLVLALNDEYFFDSFNVLPWAKGYSIYLNENEVYVSGEQQSVAVENLVATAAQPSHTLTGNGGLVYGSQRGIAYNLVYVVGVSPIGIYDQLVAFRFVLGAMLIVLIPLLVIAIRFFYLNVSRPVEQLLIGAREIEIGNFGYQLRKESHNREFDHLEQSFNGMSLQLEELFHRIYDEELALRDAKIKALQSQINPHFLNNTLEIINWEARMEGNVKVSKMIEALSTMLDAAMSRDGRKTVRLSEELMYVDAYLYIITERLGRRLTVVKEIDDTLLEHNVPRLILQPIIENAVEHGITPRQHGVITLRIVGEADTLVLQVVNDGDFTEQDAADVERLLSDDDITPLSSSRSIGIRNVHQRLRILYGSGSGLTIAPSDNETVVATIRIPLDSEE